MKNIIFPIAGGILSLLFVLFAPQLYEALYYERAFSNELYNLIFFGTFLLFLPLFVFIHNLS